MKKPSSKIRSEIAKLQEQLRFAETREAERIGRVALKAGLGDMEIDETQLQMAFEEVAKRFQNGNGVARSGSRTARTGADGSGNAETPLVAPGAAARDNSEA
jgi:hypothetical protein